MTHVKSQMTNSSPPAGLLLAGGYSRRMGRDKALLERPSGKTYLQHAVDRLREVTDEVWIAARADQRETHDIADAYFVDEQDDAGPMPPLVAALTRAKGQGRAGILVTPVDTPNLTAADLQRILDVAAPDRPTVAINSADEVQALIAFYPAGLFERMDEIYHAGCSSPRRFAVRQNAARVTLSDKSLWNHNHPAP